MFHKFAFSFYPCSAFQLCKCSAKCQQTLLNALQVSTNTALMLCKCQQTLLNTSFLLNSERPLPLAFQHQ